MTTESKDAKVVEMKKLVRFLKKIRGRHTELVTVYVPAGYSLLEIINQLKSEGSTTQNIKSKSTRNNVLAALDKIIQHLRIYRETPEHGLAIFCGNVSESEGAQKMGLWAVEPPEKVQNKLYWCDQAFVLEPLEEMVKEKEVYGLLAVDKSEATIGYLTGKKITVFKHIESLVPGKTAAGGWCIHEESLVQTPDGRLVNIKDLKNGKVESFNFLLDKTESANFDAIEGRKASKAYEVITQIPSMRIVTTPEHNFFVLDKGMVTSKPLAEIKKGDFLLSPIKLNVKGKLVNFDFETPKTVKITKKGINFLKNERVRKDISQYRIAKVLSLSQTIISKLELGKRMLKIENLDRLLAALDLNKKQFYKNYTKSEDLIKIPKVLNENLSQFLGYFMGDGGKDIDKVRFYERDMQLARFYKDLSKNLFGINIKIRKRPAKGYYEVDLYSHYLADFICSVFPTITGRARFRYIPEFIQMSRNTEVAAFVKGLFDAEGYIDRSAKLIGITMSSESAMRVLQQLFLRFGIVSSFSIKSPKGSFSKRSKYSIRITSLESIKKYSQMIGFSSKNKTRQLMTILTDRKASRTNYTTLGNLIGTKVTDIKPVNSPGLFYDISVPKFQNFVANGFILHNSQARYDRIRAGLLNDFLKEVAEIATQAFKDNKSLLGIIIGGPGPVKDDFNKDGYLHYELQKKVVGVVDISYTNEPGLHELVNRAQKILVDASVTKEIELMKKFFTELQKDSGLAIYGWEKVKAALQSGMLQRMLVSEDFDWVRAKLKCGSCGNEEMRDYKPVGKQLCPKCRMEMRTGNTEELIDVAVDDAGNFSTEYFIVSSSTREGAQLKELGGIGGILRYKTKY